MITKFNEVVYMTRKIKKLLFVEEGWLSVFLKPAIKATKMGEKIDIEFTYKC